VKKNKRFHAKAQRKRKVEKQHIAPYVLNFVALREKK
jgi:hypothetical protein